MPIFLHKPRYDPLFCTYSLCWLLGSEAIGTCGRSQSPGSQKHSNSGSGCNWEGCHPHVRAVAHITIGGDTDHPSIIAIGLPFQSPLHTLHFFLFAITSVQARAAQPRLLALLPWPEEHVAPVAALIDLQPHKGSPVWPVSQR
ncbi:hypothetical protein CGRA01v4_13068 [Colletotrichum graminicola]|nr:hypothetical protein CGRA01v4_13068 [Colletotrichum graminicola]